jgi:transketolase
MVISDNDTKLSGRITKDAFSMQPTFAAMSGRWAGTSSRWPRATILPAFFWRSSAACARRGPIPRAPVCLWVKTIKGYGVKSTMESASGGHGFPLANGEKIIEFVNEIYFGGEVPAELAAWAGPCAPTGRKKDAAKKAKAAAAPRPPPPSRRTKSRPAWARAAVRAAQEGLPVFSVSSDVQGSTGISLFPKEFPDRFLDIGVAEANMISTAAGWPRRG